MNYKEILGYILILTSLLAIIMQYPSIGVALVMILGCKLVNWI